MSRRADWLLGQVERAISESVRTSRRQDDTRYRKAKSRARQLLQQFIALDQNGPEGWYYLGLAVDPLESKQWCFEKALSIRPDYPLALHALERLLGEQPRGLDLEGDQQQDITASSASKVPNQDSLVQMQGFEGLPALHAEQQLHLETRVQSLESRITELEQDIAALESQGKRMKSD